MEFILKTVTPHSTKLVNSGVYLDIKHNCVLSNHYLPTLDVNELRNFVLNDENLKYTIGNLSLGIRSEIGFAKNTVVEYIQEFVNQVDDKLNRFEEDNPINNYKIDFLSIPEFIHNGALKSELSKYKRDSGSIGSVNNINSISVEHPNLENGILSTMVMTGNDNLDAYIAIWIDSMPEDFLLNIWNTYFINSVGMNDTSFLYGNINIWIAIYLLVRRLKNNPIDMSMRLSSTSYFNIMSNIQELVGNYILLCIQNYENMKKSNIVIFKRNLTTKTVTVHDAVYSEWINEGGQPEAILGALYSQSRHISKSDLTANMGELIDKWNTYTKNTYAAKKLLAVSQLKLIYSMVTKELTIPIITESDMGADIIKKIPDYTQIVIAKSTEYVDKLCNTEILDKKVVAERIVAKYMFGFTNAYKILKYMREASILDPSLTVNQCQYMAEIYLLSDHLVDQMIIKK